jgi:hypothetical protein
VWHALNTSAATAKMIVFLMMIPLVRRPVRCASAEQPADYSGLDA